MKWSYFYSTYLAKYIKLYSRLKYFYAYFWLVIHKDENLSKARKKKIGRVRFRKKFKFKL
jgi:hypothetical protein